MRLPTVLSLRAARSLRTALPAAALALTPALYGVSAHAAAAEPAPTCGDETASDFPVETRLHGGPDHYARGGGWQEWHLELRNTTNAECRAVHPVAVLVDQGHALRPRQIQLEFLDPYADGGTWRDVSFQTTDEDENIGVFEKDFKGFTVAAGKTVDVQIRSRFTSDAPLGPVTANAIAVQRRADDGNWVGESNDYAFRIDAVAGAEADATSGAETAPVPVPPVPEPEPDARPDAKPSAEPSGEPSPTPTPTRRLERSPMAVPQSPDAAEPDQGSDEDLDVDTDPGTGTDGTGAADEADTEADDTGTDTSADAGTDTSTDSGTDTGTETGSDTGADLGTETGTGTETDTGTGTDPGYDTEDPSTEDPSTEDPGAEDPGAAETDPGQDQGDDQQDDQREDQRDDEGDTEQGHTGRHWKPELAATGRDVRLAGLGVLSAGMVAAGAALVAKSRRARR
ncbi:hypothetical protein ACH4TX_39100 [Streptomyces sp. NPDC021098]|uniref:hypothetical protein n=1 Tax=unclassified Streptomyces TaxID=2593676 RepID=UPI0037B441CC